jgi:Tachylectin
LSISSPFTFLPQSYYLIVIALTLFGGGVIYIVKKNGDLLWYKHLGYRDGSFTWEASSGKKVGNGWTDFYAVFSGGNGVIYLIDNDGNLYWYKHAGFATGSNVWYGGRGIL